MTHHHDMPDLQQHCTTAFLPDGSELAGLIQGFDWEATALGPLGQWPQSLRTVTGLVLLSPAPMALLWGEAGTMIYNDAYAAIAGARHPQLLGSEVRSGWPEIAIFNDHVMKVCLAGGALAYKDKEMTLHRNGQAEQVWLNLDYSPVLDETGSPAGVIAIVAETTNRFLAIEAVRQNEKRLSFLDELSKRLVDTTDAGVALGITTKLLGEHLNASVCAYADMAPDETMFTIRGDWHAPGATGIVGHYNLEAFGQQAMQALNAGEPLVLTDTANQLPTHEAATFLDLGLAATICIPLMKAGALTALMAVHDSAPREWTTDELRLITDVTERSWAYVERVRLDALARTAEQRFRQELEAQVAERTTLLANTEQALRQSQKMEALGNLTGGIAHDFNNLLMAVLGNLELLAKRLPDDPQLQRWLSNARQGARRGAALTSRMLTFARKQDIKLEQVNIPRLIEGMMDLLESSLGPTITIEIQLAEPIAEVRTDSNLLESAILNLAINARDSLGSSGNVRIAASMKALTADHQGLVPGLYVCLSVKDNGAGMDETTLQRATEPFFTTKEVGSGTGLGLSMTHGLAQHSGGSLVLESQPGVGTTATIWLPALQPMHDHIGHQVASTHKLHPTAPLRILAVDDDDLVLLSTVDMLTDQGHRVFCATSAERALEMLKGERYDVLLTDFAMPHMTGTELAAKAWTHHPDLPAVLVTGYSQLSPTPDARMLCLAKPFTQADLLEIIARAIESKRA